MQVGRDPRPVMREAYNMFKDGGDPEQVRSRFFILTIYIYIFCANSVFLCRTNDILSIGTTNIFFASFLALIVFVPRII